MKILAASVLALGLGLAAVSASQAMPIAPLAGSEAGNGEVKFTISYQQCNDQSCYPPSTLSGSAKLQVVGGAAPVKAKPVKKKKHG